MKFAFLLLEYCKIRECYAVVNTFTIRNIYCLLLYMKCSSRKTIVPRKTWRKFWHSYISKLFLTKMQVKFSIFFHRGSLNVIGDTFRFVRSKLKSSQDSRERGKGDWHWLFTKIYFDRLPVSPPRKRTKTSSSTPNLKSPPSLLKKSLSVSKYLYPFKRVSTPIRRNLFTKDDGTSPQIYKMFPLRVLMKV